MSFIKLPTELLDADITPAQLKILANLIRYSFEDGHTYIGYSKLATACKSNKSAIIKSVKVLEQKGYLTIQHRGVFSRSNDITLTIERGCTLSANRGAAGSPKGCLNDTPKGCLNDTLGCLNNTPHIDKDLNTNIYFNDKKSAGCLNNTPKAPESQLAPLDVANGRTIANSKTANRVGVASLCNNNEDITLWELLSKKNFQWWVDFDLVRIGDQYLLRPLSANELTNNIRFEELKEVAAAAGFTLQFMRRGMHSVNEIVINKEVA